MIDKFQLHARQAPCYFEVGEAPPGGSTATTQRNLDVNAQVDLAKDGSRWEKARGQQLLIIHSK